MYYVVYKAKSGIETRHQCRTREEAMNYYRRKLPEMLYSYIADEEAEESEIGTELMEAAAVELENRRNAYENMLVNWDLIL